MGCAMSVLDIARCKNKMLNRARLMCLRGMALVSFKIKSPMAVVTKGIRLYMTDLISSSV